MSIRRLIEGRDGDLACATAHALDAAEVNRYVAALIYGQVAHAEVDAAKASAAAAGVTIDVDDLRDAARSVLEVTRARSPEAKREAVESWSAYRVAERALRAELAARRAELAAEQAADREGDGEVTR